MSSRIKIILKDNKSKLEEELKSWTVGKEYLYNTIIPRQHDIIEIENKPVPGITSEYKVLKVVNWFHSSSTSGSVDEVRVYVKQINKKRITKTIIDGISKAKKQKKTETVFKTKGGDVTFEDFLRMTAPSSFNLEPIRPITYKNSWSMYGV